MEKNEQDYGYEQPIETEQTSIDYTEPYNEMFDYE